MIQENIDLKPFNTFGISVRSKRFGVFSSVEQLHELLDHRQNDRIMILGGGSNVLFTRDFDGLMLKNELCGSSVIHEDESYATVKVGAGEVWHKFVMNSIDQNLGGIENLSLIPGNVGASPMQNIGAYGVEIKEVFVSLEAFHIATHEIHTFDAKDCEFGYRESVFKRRLKNEYIILSVTYRLAKKHSINSSYGAIESELNARGVSSPTIRDVSNAVIAIRSKKLPNPKHLGNAGSFFKNPIVSQSIFHRIQEDYEHVPHYPVSEENVKLPAGWLIEKAGWKGKQFGTYGVHAKQALVLVNYGKCSGKEIYDLSENIIVDIHRKFGIQLEREVNIV